MTTHTRWALILYGVPTTTFCARDIKFVPSLGLCIPRLGLHIPRLGLFIPSLGIVISNFAPPKFRKVEPPEIGKVKPPIARVLNLG